MGKPVAVQTAGEETAMMKDNLKKKLFALGIAAALPVVALFEGTALKSYADPIGKPTICRGHTQGVKLGQTATLDECDAHTVADLIEANTIVDSCVHVPLQDHQRAAFVSFTFNVGPGAKGVKDGFCTLKSGEPSTIVKKLHAKDYAGACQQMRLWIRAGGKVLKGLISRREAEVNLCLGQSL